MPRYCLELALRKPILASGRPRPHQQAGHMIAIASICTLRRSCKPGAVHIWVARSSRAMTTLGMLGALILAPIAPTLSPQAAGRGGRGATIFGRWLTGG